MKKRFYEGEEVVCIDKEMNPLCPEAVNAPDLTYNNLYVIDRYVYCKDGIWFVTIIGIDDEWCYSEDTFAPITQISELLEDVNEKSLQKQMGKFFDNFWNSLNDEHQTI